MANVILGIGLMLISTSCMQIGTVLQKKAVDSLPPMEQTAVGQSVKGVLSNKIWLLGWFLTTSAMILNMAALGQADITIIQPLIGFGLVVLVIFSHFYLKEKITKFEVIGISIAIIGVIILGLYAEESRVFTSTEEVLQSYTQMNAFIIIIIFAVVISALWMITIKMHYKGAGIIFALIAASFSVLGLTFSKGVFSILDIIGLKNSLVLWQEWLLLGLFAICSTMAIAVQQMSLQKGKAVVVTPIFNLASIILPLATGYMVFSEKIGFGKILVIIIILIGGIFLSLKPAEQLDQ
ncbi:MAG: DMT family transporter [Promethearchaeota archaeon]